MRTKEEIKKIENEIKDAIFLNGYKKVDTELIKSLKKLELSEKTLNFNDQLLEMYSEYLFKLIDLPQDISLKYLEVIKDADVIDNQSLEMVDSFLVAIYSRLQKEHAIDILLKKEKLDGEILKDVHDSIIYDATSTNQANGFRTTDTKVVGNIIAGKKNVQYIPVDSDKIEFISNYISSYANDETNESLYRIFIKPIILHGLIAAYQLFDDGNTRTARCVQHAKIFQMTNNFTGFNLALPALYISKQYYPYRAEYRKLITQLVLEPSNENWNNWISFNFRRIEENLYYSMDKLDEMYSSQMEVLRSRLNENIKIDKKRG
ncbi:MAG: hypothetical protein E7158_05995 [Firmicutes bacterium]|nr:hypothetical protein [Bacillota bacterium]